MGFYCNIQIKPGLSAICTLQAGHSKLKLYLTVTLHIAFNTMFYLLIVLCTCTCIQIFTFEFNRTMICCE